MALSEYLRFAVNDFGGANNRLDPANVPPDQALVAQNCEFEPGSVGHRLGFGVYPTVSPAVTSTSFYPWVHPSSAVYLAGFGDVNGVGTGYVYLVSLGGVLSLYVPAGGSTVTGAQFASAGQRIYVASFNELLSGTDHGRVCTTTTADKLFPPPLTAKPTLGASGAGAFVTAGTHRVGYLIQSRSGYSGRISPVSALTLLFDETSTVTVTAGQQIDFSLTRTWPSDAALVYPVMTTVDNLERYFIVPGINPTAVVGGVSSTVTFTINISDGDLASVGTDITANNLLLTQGLAGSAPFNPFSVATFGPRMVYLAGTDGLPSSVCTAYISEPDNPQQLTADQNVLYLPGQRMMTAMGTLGRILYILGPNWTYSFEDTGDVPVLWPPARLVDGSIGTLAPRGFTVDATTGVGWCAHQTGLYRFIGGAYDPLPASYNCNPDWQRINWSALGAALTQVIDNKEKHQVHVVAPLLVNATVNVSGTAVTWVSGNQFPTSLLASSTGATPFYPQIVINGVARSILAVVDSTHITLRSSGGTLANATATITPHIPTNILTFDYTNGATPDKIKYSSWVIKNYAIGGACMMQNPSTKAIELWLGQYQDSSGLAANARVFRQKNPRADTSPYNDNLLAIDFQWQGPLLPPVDGDVYYHYAQQLRATGSGTLSRTMYGLDNTVSQAITALALSTTPGQMYTNRYPRVRSEGASCLFSMNTADEYCRLSELGHLFGRGPSRR